MFGMYEDFPGMQHSAAQFGYETSTKNLQEAIIQSLYQLNQNKDGPDLPEFTSHDIKVELELGIADGLTFSYIDEEILKRCQERIRNQVFSALDFLCVVRYYDMKGESRTPLRFDYHMLRFVFGEKNLELRVYHERGTRRLSIDDLVQFLIEKANQELARRKLSLIKISDMWAL